MGGVVPADGTKYRVGISWAIFLEKAAAYKTQVKYTHAIVIIHNSAGGQGRTARWCLLALEAPGCFAAA